MPTRVLSSKAVRDTWSCDSFQLGVADPNYGRLEIELKYSSASLASQNRWSHSAAVAIISLRDTIITPGLDISFAVFG